MSTGKWIMAFSATLFLPLLLLIFAKIVSNKSRNLGYNSRRARKNQKTMEFAKEEFYKNLVRSAFFCMALSLIVMPFTLHKEQSIVKASAFGVLAVQCFNSALTFYRTERALKRNFDDNGKKKK